MNQPPDRPRLSIVWSPEARAELRCIERNHAIAILKCLDRFTLTQVGDLKVLQPPLQGTRLRCGDYRILFDKVADDAIEITAVRNRRDAYR